MLDDIVTPGIRGTRSVPQGDPCAVDLFGAAFGHTSFEVLLPVGNRYLGLLLFADNCWIAMSPGELQSMARAWNELLESSGLQTDWGEAVWCSTAQDSKHHRVGNGDHSTNTREEGFEALGVDHYRWSLHIRIG